VLLKSLTLTSLGYLATAAVNVFIQPSGDSAKCEKNRINAKITKTVWRKIQLLRRFISV